MSPTASGPKRTTAAIGSLIVDKVIDYRWDSNGFLIHKIADDGGANDSEHYTPNAECRLAAYACGVSTCTLAYDHVGKQMSTTVYNGTSTRTITNCIQTCFLIQFAV